MAQKNDRFPSIAEEDSSETTLSLPTLNLRLNSSETTETTNSENVVAQGQLTIPECGPSEGTFAPTGSREIHFLPRPNGSTRNNLRRPTEAGQRNEFLFLLTTDSNTSKSEDDEIRVEEEEEAHIEAEPRRSLGSLYREIKFELLPQEAEEEVEVAATRVEQASETRVDGDDSESTGLGEDEERTRDEGTDSYSTTTEATESNGSQHCLLSDEALLLPRLRPHEDSVGSCCEDEDIDADETAVFGSKDPMGSATFVLSSADKNPVEVTPSARAASSSNWSRPSKPRVPTNSTNYRTESSLSWYDSAPLATSPANQKIQETSVSKSSSALSVSSHSVDTPPVPPRRSPLRGDSPPPAHDSPLHQATNDSPLRPRERKLASSPTSPPMPAPNARSNRQPGLVSLVDLKSARAQVVTPSHSPVLSASVTSAPRIRRLDGDDAPEITTGKNAPAPAIATVASDSVSSSVMVASVQKPKNLYDELLAYHREHEASESNEQDTVCSSSRWNKPSHLIHNPHRLKSSNRSRSPGSVLSSEDSKQPARNQPLSTHENLASSNFDYHSAALYQELRAARESKELDQDVDSPMQLASQTSPGHLEADEAIARILQEEMDAEQHRSEEESLRAALALQRQEEEALLAQSRQASSHEILLPLALSDGTSIEEQQRILKQIRAQQEEKLLHQALNLSSHNSPSDVTHSMATEPSILSNQIGAPVQPRFHQWHQPRFPPPQPHAYPHRRTMSVETPGDFSPTANGSHMNNDYLVSPAFRTNQSEGAQPSVSSSTMSEAFERQFRPRDDLLSRRDASLQQASMSGSFRRRPVSSSLASGPTRPAWELSQQEALEEIQRHQHQREQSTRLHAREQPLVPMIPLIPAAELDLVRRGATETARAVEGGRAHIVQCQNCRARLQAPIQYALVYCPNCGMVSPGRSYVPTLGGAPTSGTQTSINSDGQHNPPEDGFRGRSHHGDDGSSDARSWY